ncbi:hypothetical protein Trco_004933 [Trichoderma cornu-damae]|uniref:Uncharacterized protein n=1 Tax=Trichoderma cornu-damae TaxID=654480 RepID=A0A9P8QGM1_9HYPO|nr:hypothetical protein Trco_004933 [Trichoderma cornu-damae]
MCHDIIAGKLSGRVRSLDVVCERGGGGGEGQGPRRGLLCSRTEYPTRILAALIQQPAQHQPFVGGGGSTLSVLFVSSRLVLVLVLALALALASPYSGGPFAITRTQIYVCAVWDTVHSTLSSVVCWMQRLDKAQTDR